MEKPWNKADLQPKIEKFISFLEMISIRDTVGSQEWRKEVQNICALTFDLVEMDWYTYHLEEMLKVKDQALRYGEALKKLGERGVSLQDLNLETDKK